MVSISARVAISSLYVALCFCRGAEPREAIARSIPLKFDAAGKTGFTSMAGTTTGIAFTNNLPEPRFRTNQILLNGSGIAAGDVDGDGYCDLYFARLNGENALYRNLGNWRFENITTKAGVACALMDSTGVALADIDGDGDLDLIANSVGNGTHIFLNNGKAQFRELAAPLNSGRGGMSMALGDVNGDGYLDLYIANYRTLGLMDMPNTRFWLVKTNGQQVVSTVNGRSVNEPDLANRFAVTAAGGIEELGEPDLLLLSQGGTNFIPMPFGSGAFVDEDGKPLSHLPFEWGLSVMVRDINQDGLPDIYVCNDFDGPDRLWLNQGGGKFRAAPRLALRRLSFFSMGADVADINRDGFDDIFVADMLSRDHIRRMNFLPERKAHFPSVGELEDRPQYARNTLFLNRGDGTYAEIANLAGVQASEWSWSPAFLDVDLDGWEDLLITNGHERDARNMDKLDEIKRLRATGKIKSNADTFEIRKIFPRLATANIAFRNNHDLTFAETGKPWGFDYEGVSQGIAFADLDNDGDLDVIINNLNAAPLLLRNDSIAPRVAVRLKGAAPNTAGTGARIIVNGGPVRQEQEMMSGGRYLSSDEPLRVFAAGTADKLSITVKWRSGRVSEVSALPNHLCVIEEPNAASPAKMAERPAPAPLFRDASDLLNHSHRDEPFDDLSLQPLLPYKLSQLGPGLTWHDVDGDGWEDAIIGSGKGGSMAVFRNDHGRFAALAEPMFNSNPATKDQTTIIPWPKGPGRVALLAGAASWEQSSTNESCVAEYDLGSKMILNRMPGSPSSTGPLALSDIDGDGDLDLFVGGRAASGRYPSAATSLVFRNLGGRWELDTTNTAALANAGMVSGAVFSDVNGDGRPDLVLACDWGPVRLFTNAAGVFREVTREAGLESYTGWWTGVATGDFDGDGRLDIVAANWGRNTPYQPYRTGPLTLFYGDFIGDGGQQIIEAHYEESLKKTVPNRGMDALAKVMPAIRGRFATYDAYAHASVEEILGEAWGQAKKLEARYLETTVFLNRGTGFVARPLHALAQAAPAFGVCVADADGDGNEDIFLAQNFFATHTGFPRCDAGIGLWLLGDGRGEFAVTDATRSGVKVYGEQRGAAVADYDHDGRVDLLVSQNGRETKLFHNERGQVGLRIKITGPALNPNGVGTILRLRHGKIAGPAREIQTGSGYWSCNAPVQIMGPLEGATEVEAHWPGGATSIVPVPAGAREITLSPPPTSGK